MVRRRPTLSPLRASETKAICDWRARVEPLRAIVKVGHETFAFHPITPPARGEIPVFAVRA